MSGRRFRIVSDSEDDDNDDSQRSTTAKSITRTESANCDSDDGNDLENVTNKKKRRALLESDDDEENELEEESINRNEGTRNAAPEAVRDHPSVGEKEANEEENSENETTDEEQRGERISVDQDDNIDGDEHNDMNNDNHHDDGDGDRENGGGDEADGEAIEASEKTLVKKRVVKNPQPKLDATRLTGERGLGRLRNMHPYIKFNGKGHEREDLRCVLHHLQLWGHRMFPRMQMKDIFERCERLGTKMPVKIYLRKMRTGQIYDFNQPMIDDEDDVQRITEDGENNDDDLPAVEKNNDRPSPTVMENGHDLFEELMASERAAKLESKPNESTADNTGSKNSEVTSAPTIDDDLRAQIEAKRLEAMRRREQKMNGRKQMQAQNSATDEFTEVQLDQQMAVDS